MTTINYSISSIKTLADFSRNGKTPTSFGAISIIAIDPLSYSVRHEYLMHIFTNLRPQDREELDAYRVLMAKLSGTDRDLALSKLSLNEYILNQVQDMCFMELPLGFIAIDNSTGLPFAVFGAKSMTDLSHQAGIFILGTPVLDNPLFVKAICLLSSKFCKAVFIETDITILFNFVYLKNDKAVKLIKWLGFGTWNTVGSEDFLTAVLAKTP